MTDPDLVTRLEGRGAWVQIYQGRAAVALEWLLKVVHEGPLANPEGVARTYWEGVTDASDGLQHELRQLFWEEVKGAIATWQPTEGTPSYGDLRAALDRANAIIGQEADKAKRLSDEVARLDELVVRLDRRIENMTRPCPNHPRVRLAPDEGCAVCANST